jgi:V/A-type H+-transporting ATPase subunit E
MAYENLLKSVEESEQERERELWEKAQKQAGEIRADAKRQAGEIQKNAVQEAEKSATIERNKQLYLTKGEIKEQALRRRETIFTAAFDQAGQRLSELRQDPKYPVIFEKLAHEATGAMSDRPFLVHVDKRDEELCRKTLAAMNIRCDVLTDLQCMGGLVVRSPDGLITISNTIESRLERIREHKKLEIHAILSGG